MAMLSFCTKLLPLFVATREKSEIAEDKEDEDSIAATSEFIELVFDGVLSKEISWSPSREGARGMTGGDSLSPATPPPSLCILSLLHLLLILINKE